MSEWISVDDGYPEESGMYLCHFADGVIETFPLYDDDICEIEETGNITWGVESESGWITHWMPLPDAPR